MTIFCTYCSAQKDKTKAMLPAIERYQSKRIQSICSAANLLDIPLYILSGKYGILNPSDPIPWYDHLLEDSEVSVYLELIVRQIKDLGITDIIIFTVSPKRDKNVAPYLDAIKLATDILDIQIKLVVIDFDD